MVGCPFGEIEMRWAMKEVRMDRASGLRRLYILGEGPDRDCEVLVCQMKWRACMAERGPGERCVFRIYLLVGGRLGGRWQCISGMRLVQRVGGL